VFRSGLTASRSATVTGAGTGCLLAHEHELTGYWIWIRRRRRRHPCSLTIRQEGERGRSSESKRHRSFFFPQPAAYHLWWLCRLLPFCFCCAHACMAPWARWQEPERSRAEWRHYLPLRQDEDHQPLGFRAGARLGRVSRRGVTRPRELRPFAASCIRLRVNAIITTSC
jgi:hypothetical protein